MPSCKIPDNETLRREIEASHARCRSYGIDPHLTCNPNQVHLTPEELKARLVQQREFLDVAEAQIKELHRFLAGANFVVSVTDRDGYMLEIIEDPLMMDFRSPIYCRAGFRWTERDVGTSATSLALERRIPVQINESEHYCYRGHDYTCSASPVFQGDDELLGVLALSGKAVDVHPHTLGMVITAAKAIENQIKITRTSKELLIRNNYMNALIDSIDSGVMAIDRQGRITQINDLGRRILRRKEDLMGAALNSLLDTPIDLHRMLRAGFEYVDKEIFIRGTGRTIQLINTAKPILDSEGKVQGVLFVFHEIKRIRRLINEMAGYEARFTFKDIVGVSPSLEEAKKLAMLAAASKSTALLLGETGTGKELFAQSIHNQSERHRHPFVAINCCAIPRELLESELFGFADGAFTGARKGGRPGKFELASGGTLFLDEIGDMPYDMQGKLLRVLQTGEVTRIGEHKPISVNVRIVAATNCDLKQEVGRGNFREDLFYRLNVFPITLPPLRDRGEDIVILARHILARRSKILNKTGVVLSPETEALLTGYHWPGNIRELENAIERAINLVEEKEVHPQHFNLAVKDDREAKGNGRGARLVEVEKQAIIDTIKAHDYNLLQSARSLGISRATLYKKIDKYNLSINRKSV